MRKRSTPPKTASELSIIKNTYADERDVLKDEVARNVKEHLNKSGMTQIDLAEKIGMDASSLTRSLRGLREFNLYEMKRIAEILDVSVHTLIYGCAPDQSNLQRQLSLSSFALDWLMNPSEKRAPLMDILNTILKNESIADTLFRAIYNYSTVSVPTTSFKKDGTIDIRSRILDDDDTLVKYATLGCFEEILDTIRKEYDSISDNYYRRTKEKALKEAFHNFSSGRSKKSANKSEQEAQEEINRIRKEVEKAVQRASYEVFKQDFSKLLDRNAELVQAKADDMEDFDQEAEEAERAAREEWAKTQELSQ